MRRLKIEYVQRPPRQPEELPDDVVEVYISISGREVDLTIGRRGFMQCGALQFNNLHLPTETTVRFTGQWSGAGLARHRLSF
jgi:hypothetical protein